MPNSDGARARPKHRNRNRPRARPCTPENLLENHLQKLFEQQELLHSLLISNRPGVRTQLEDLGGDSNYEFDTQDEDGDYESLPSFQVSDAWEEPKKLSNRADSVVLAEDVDSSSPPKFENLPAIPSRTYPYCRNHSSMPLPITMGNCTPPKVIGQGYDAPFLYPNFISKKEKSRVKYIFTLVDSLVLQMERLLKQGEHSMAEGAVEKPASGAVPKSRPKQDFQVDRVGHAKYTVAVNSRLNQPKQHNPSKHHHRLGSSKVHSHSKLPENFDLDCEFGMEYIEKFRANKVRDENLPEPEKHTDYTDEEELKELGITIIPDSEIPSELHFPEIAMAKSFKRHRRCKRKDSRPSTPITRPSTPIGDDVPSTSAQAKFYQQFTGHLEPEKSESSILTPWQLLKVRGKSRKVFHSVRSQRDSFPTTAGPEPLKEWQWDIIRYMRQFNKEKKRRQRLAKQLRDGELPAIDEEPVLKVKKRDLRREELQRKYSYVPIDRPKIRPKFYKAFKRQKEWLKAEREYKRVQYLTYFRPQDLYEPRIKVTKKQRRAIRRRLLNVPSRGAVQPKPMPKTKTPLCPLPADEKVKVEVPNQDPPPIPGPVDRGQRLKNLLMDKIRLNQDQKLNHLVLPEDPVKAIYLPLPHRRKSAQSASKMNQNSAHKKPKSAPLFLTSATSSTAAINGQSSCSSIPAETNSSSSLSTLFYDAKHTKSGNDFGMSNESVAGFRKSCDPAKNQVAKPLGRKCNNEAIAKDAPEEGVDFRRYIDLDFVSRQILQLMSKMKPHKDSKLVEVHPKVSEYMDHFYWERLTPDGLFFHWFLCEGFFPAHYLTKVKTAKELEDVSQAQLDQRIMEYIDLVNDVNATKIKLTSQMAHLMVTSYFRVLYHRAQSSEYPIKDRCLLRCRFAISMVELHQQERGRHILRNRVDCRLLMKWALKHEGRVKQLYDEPLYYAEERASINTCLVMRTPNLEAFKEFYHRQVLPKPDALAINPVFYKIKRYPSSETDLDARFVCPIPGCQTDLSSKILMAHFLTDHCRRLEELWLTDRMVLLFCPSSYPPNQVYCICVIALLARMPSQTVPIPKVILNEELPSKYLYFVEHGACFIMFAPVSRLLIEGKAEQKPASKKGANRHLDTLYIFWLATADYELKDAGCRLFVYCQDRGIKGKSLLNFVKMSEFKGVAHLVATQPDSYLAIDYATMASLTKDFRELLFIEVRYIDKLVEDSNNSGDENFDI
ncbi:LOW QUALITY PROTEIN: uncharacterized protein Dere_GG17618 [Drosophila erecta]|uniref:DUF4729 domain-containing protein n=1 Tax=Drosophila erecta TaxID=7220 RepID=A0A0Q5T8G6_DROER|nr:LOW QUALITY PROTEIN: uncharacterized protein Dere_GG17618 [Drosophila erecta]